MIFVLANRLYSSSCCTWIRSSDTEKIQWWVTCPRSISSIYFVTTVVWLSVALFSFRMDLIDSETLYSLLRNKYVLLCGDSGMRSWVIWRVPVASLSCLLQYLQGYHPVDPRSKSASDQRWAESKTRWFRHVHIEWSATGWWQENQWHFLLRATLLFNQYPLHQVRLFDAVFQWTNEKWIERYCRKEISDTGCYSSQFRYSSEKSIEEIHWASFFFHIRSHLGYHQIRTKQWKGLRAITRRMFSFLTCSNSSTNNYHLVDCGNSISRSFYSSLKECSLLAFRLHSPKMLVAFSMKRVQRRRTFFAYASSISTDSLRS